MKLALGQAVYEILYNFLHKCDVWSCDVWSYALVRRLAFWTFSCLPSTSKSNPQLLLAPFGLPRISLHFKVHSATLARSFWTSSHLPSTSKSILPRFLAPFGLPPASSPLQSPILRSFSLLLDFLLPPLHFKVQSSALSHSFWTSSCLSSASRSNPPRSRSPPRKKGGLQSNPPVSFRQF